MTQADPLAQRPRQPLLRRPLVLIAATTFIAIAIGAAYLAVRSSGYEATANVLVSPVGSEDPAYQGLPLIRESSDGARPVQTGTGLLSGPAVARLAARRLASGVTAEEVEGQVTVVPRGESNIVAITASTESAKSAAETATAYAKAALDLRRQSLLPAVEEEIAIAAGESERVARLRSLERTGDPALSLAAVAAPPSGSSDLSAELVLILAALIGFLLGLGLVLLIDVVRAPQPQP